MVVAVRNRDHHLQAAAGLRLPGHGDEAEPRLRRGQEVVNPAAEAAICILPGEPPECDERPVECAADRLGSAWRPPGARRVAGRGRPPSYPAASFGHPSTAARLKLDVAASIAASIAALLSNVAS